MAMTSEERKDFLDSLDNLKELNDVSQILQDEEIDKTLVNVVKIMQNPNVGPEAAAHLIGGFTAQYFVYKVKYKYYMLHKDEPDARLKKEMNQTISEDLMDVVIALKYIFKM